MLRQDLARLAARLDGALALVSGRPLAALDELFAWDGRAAGAVYGSNLRTLAGERHVLGDPEIFARVRARAAELVAATPGVVLEDKQTGLGLYYDREPRAAEAIARELLRITGSGYATMHGRQGIELKPAGADKGRAIGTLMATPEFRGRTPWMLGDDGPDEPGFVRVNALGGVAVVVGPHRPTAARHALPDPAATRAWLHRLAHRGEW